MRKLAFLIPAAVLASVTASVAHNAPMGWAYDTYCCNGNGMSGDCQPIPTKAVKAVSGGYQITLHAGEHRLATKDHVFFITYQAVRKSGDDQYHACLYPTEDTLRCFYAPPQSF